MTGTVHTLAESGSKPRNSHIESATRKRRLLLPINACEDSRWGLQYARQLHESGTPVEAILLNVGEPVTQWQVLRFRTQQEIAEFQAARAQSFIEDASEQLESAGIPWRGVYRQGELVFSILDAAEELDCDEIVMPTHGSCLSNLFSRPTTAEVRRQQRHVPVVMVDSRGARL
jgi:nucleotide-binding universal stress UspA family protein